MKAILIMLAPILALLCLSGCGTNNCVTVDAGRPFVAQEGMRYGIAEGGITYTFNRDAYPNAQVVYVDPDKAYDLQPSTTYVMLVDPTYLVRRQQQQASDDETMESIKNQSDSLQRSVDSFRRNTNQTMDGMLRSTQQMDRNNSQTLGILQGVK
jgi:hypothetical protein